MPVVRHVAGVTVALALAATVHQVLVAGRVLDLGAEPGNGAPFTRIVLIAALAVLVCGAALLAASVSSRITGAAVRPSASTVLAAPAAALLVVARFSAFDPYYAPDLHRMWEGGLVGPGWIGLVASGGALAGLAVARAGRAGLAVAGPALWACGGTTLAAGLGH
jgi:hypothetical protein